MATNATGRFVWFDLANEDADKAKPFYTQVIGWKTTRVPEYPDYEMWTAGDKPVGGCFKVPELPSSPQWVGYIAVESVDSTLQRAQKMGGKGLGSPVAMPSGGKFALLSDPQGATLGIYQAPKASDPPDLRANGQIGWVELRTTDWQAAMRFYSEAFGWKVSQTMNMGPEMGDYVMYGLDTKPENMFGGMSNTSNAFKVPPHWLYYVNVPDTDGIAKKVPSLGGKVISGPMDVPGGSRIAQCQDPKGGSFGLMTPAKQ